MAALRDACQQGVNPGPGEGPSMSRTRTVLLALVAAFIVSLLGAPAASAATAVIDANDDAGPGWGPKDVSIAVGDSVRWEFDETQTTHNLSSSGGDRAAPLDLHPAPHR